MERLFQAGANQLEEEEFYTSRGVTHVVSIGVTTPSNTIVDKLSLRVHRLLEDDVPTAKLRKHFEETTRFIHKARLSGEVVLVHCYAGVSRSSTITLAYLMTWLGLQNKEALSLLHMQHAHATPNVGFARQLAKYEKSAECANLSLELRSDGGATRMLLSDYEDILCTLNAKLDTLTSDLKIAFVNSMIRLFSSKLRALELECGSNTHRTVDGDTLSSEDDLS